MREKIDYNCKVCGHIELKEKNWKTKIWGVVRPFLVVIFLLNFTIGSMGIYNFIQGNVLEKPDKILSIGQMYSFIVNIRSNFQFAETEEKLNNISNELVKNCNTDLCKATTIFKYLHKFDYNEENTIDLNPIRTWEERSGDCDQMSYLLIVLLQQQGIDAMIDCNNNHCWSLISLEEKEIVADLTMYRWIENDR